MRSVRALLAASVLLALAPAPGAALAQIACGTAVENETVTLTSDLDCTGHSGPAVTLQRGALRLNGFTVRGGAGVVCATACKVLGPGVVEASTASGIWSNLWNATHYTIAKVTVRGNALWGVAGFVGATEGQSVIVVRDALIETNGLSGIFGDRKITVTGSTIRDNGTANGGAGVQGLRTVRVARSTIADNRGPGVWAWSDARVVRSVVTGNDSGGVIAGHDCLLAGRADVIASTVTGNADTGCAPGACTDVASCTAPRVTRSTCDTSHRIASGLPGDDWDVCALD